MNGPELLEPVLAFLDTLIEEQGHLLYMVLVYVSLPLIAWTLSGGLRRKSARREITATSLSIIVIHPTVVRPPPLPPVIGESQERGLWPPDDDDSASFVT